MAPVQSAWRGMTSSPSASPSTSVKARTMPTFAATPPWKAMGRTNSLPMPTLLLKFRAMAWQRPATMS